MDELAFAVKPIEIRVCVEINALEFNTENESAEGNTH
jgi:hypothetical protein